MAANEEANENVIVQLSESFNEQAGQVSYRWFQEVTLRQRYKFDFHV